MSMDIAVNRTKDWLPVVGSFLIFVSILKAMFFYFAFGIRITDLIEFSEALLLFFDDILFTLASVIIVALYMLIYNATRRFSHKDKNILTTLVSGNYMVYIVYLAFTAIGFFLFMILVEFYHKNWLIVLSYLLGSMPILAMAIIFPAISARTSGAKKLNMDNIKAKEIGMLYIGIIFLLAIIVTNLLNVYSELEKIFSGKNLQYVKCVFQDKGTVETNKDTVYLGRTRNNIIFYLPKEKKSLIVATKDLNTFEVKK